MSAHFSCIATGQASFRNRRPGLRRIFSLLLWWAGSSLATAATADADFAAVREADRQRLAATIAGDLSTLGELLSADLHYAYSDGRVQTKAQFLAATRDNKVKYLSVVPEDVALQSIAAGAVAMNGRARLVAQTSDGRRVAFALRFLAVWREEAGRWRLFAYQSSQLAGPSPAAKTPATP